MRREVEAESERARAADEAARQAAQEEEERRRRARKDEIGRVREEKAAAEEAARKAAEQARKAREELEAVEKQFREWIQPVVMPTTAELKAAKEKIRYKDGEFHFAVAGVAGSGKSSLINVLCGMSNQDPNAAPTGIVETTLEVGRYTNPGHADHFAWTHVFDCVIVLFNNRFTMTDQAILTNCHRYRIPTFVVRSKADQHIRNLMKEMGYDSDDEGQTKERMYKAAREQFIAETHRSVKENLQEAQLLDQRVYIVSHKSVLGIVRDKTPKRTIDELELLRDLHNEGYKSRKHSLGVPNGAYTAAQSLNPSGNLNYWTLYLFPFSWLNVVPWLLLCSCHHN
ncbi:hypothetical protein L210DRAFT_3647596 [Boletus edulis BED1]|uniref:IRG-type G domain-containing protein n=1 Tax=Boletus edulis BED1 TaxID=1328754 RepID=A0AAD4BRC7_BOLED|nr:hypothetical protein L210DRAFT_3647596 [Boletus edulis BED1]